MAFLLTRRTSWNLLLFGVSTAAAMAAEPVPLPVGERLSIEPPGTVLDGRRASAQLIATSRSADGALRDLTAESRWTSSDPTVVAVLAGGRIEPRGDGQAEVIVRHGPAEARTVI